MEWKNPFEKKAPQKREDCEGWATSSGGPGWEDLAIELHGIKKELEMGNSSKSELMYAMMKLNWTDPELNFDEKNSIDLLKEGYDRIKVKVSSKDPLFNKVPKHHQRGEEDLGFANVKGWLHDLILEEAKAIAESKGLIQKD